MGDGFQGQGHIYVFNLRGNQRTSGEISRKEGGKVFGSGSRSSVAITLLVKRKGHVGNANVRYHDIGEYLTREQKLEIVTGFASYKAVPWVALQPNEHHDWINQRSGNFNEFVPFNDEAGAIFATRTPGVSTGRDLELTRFRGHIWSLGFRPRLFRTLR